MILINAVYPLVLRHVVLIAQVIVLKSLYMI